MTGLAQTIPGRWSAEDEQRFMQMRVRRTLALDAGSSNAMGAGLARRADPVSSHAAGIQVSEKDGDLYVTILAWLGTQGGRGGTSLEISEGTGIDRVTVSPRLKPMEKLGLVERAPDKRAGSSGIKSTVWLVSEKNL